MAVKYTYWSLNRPTFIIARPSKIYPNWDFWFKNIPSGKPVLDIEKASNTKILF
jgi:hypothetical protein